MISNALPPLIPRDVLFGNPQRISPKLSPDGTRLAYIAPKNGVMNIYVHTVGQGDDHVVTHETTRPIRSFDWAENSRQVLYPQDVGGDENFHLWAVNADGSEEPRDFTPFEGVRASLLATEPTYPNTVLVSANQRDSRCFDVYSCDLKTGDLTLVAENPGDIVGWVADANLAVRAAVVAQPDGGSEIRVRETIEAEWKTLLALPFGESGGPAGFTSDGSSLYVLSNKEVNTSRLFLADVASGELSLVHSRDDVDLNALLFHPTEHRVQAVGYNRARQEWIALDPALTDDLVRLKAVEDGDFDLLSRDNADHTWLVQYVRDDGPVNYYVYDRPTGKATFLFSNRSVLGEYALAKMMPVEITARDGMLLPAYLTLPRVDSGTTEAIPPPLVLMVHGGPWARDHWGFSADAQWLANRGYAVLQVNYRGSTGFGKAHLNAGNREWAGKMHDDLIDSVEWAVKHRHADPSLVAIYGGSYGGYATLVGLTFTPEQFACGVDVVGPSNLMTLMDSIPPYWGPIKAQFIQRVGDPETEPEFLESRSPLFFADKIVRPLFIAQGANDPRVKQAESDQIASAARENGKDVTYLLFEDEGHGFARPENRIKFCAAAEEFLAQHLGGRFEPAHEGEEPPLVKNTEA